MLRVHLLQQWYSLSDPAMEEALIEVPTMRRFAGIELISDRIPDETTILTFRHLQPAWPWLLVGAGFLAARVHAGLLTAERSSTRSLCCRTQCAGSRNGITPPR